MSDVLLTRRGGGANLNFRVTRYPLGTDLSGVTGKTNEIAVLTDNLINGWQFSTQEPENPQTGDIWIKTAETSNISFDALKKNHIVLRLMAVYQYETGAWTKKDSAVYQNGAWHIFEIWIYNRGDQCTDVTGGFDVKVVYGSVYFYDTYIQFNSSSQYGTRSTIYTTNKIDLSGKTKLCVTTTHTSSYSNGAMGLTTTAHTTLDPSWAAYLTFDINSSVAKTYVLDISAFKDRKDLCIAILMDSGRVSEIWLE